ncbi:MULTISPECIES: AAA family ATPase [Halomonadaceae]|uniref:AAA family ATPase n=1 Tax=Halomonadaceae TaxID=28256 RepID=UPI00159A34FC|nr:MULTISPECIES: AAA family ATPase [Halomonas]QJQ95432.1 AAA family ATPase [Halomonas sp. PA5]
MVSAIELGEFLATDIPPRKMLLDPWLPKSGLAMVYAPRGIGKTWFAIYTALAAASGREFLGWQAPAPVRVLYLDGEMPAVALQERLAAGVANGFVVSAPGSLNIITPDMQPDFRPMPDLSTPEGQLLLEPHSDAADLIVVDNIATLCRSGRENEGESWLSVQGWALRMRAMGKSVMFVHHAGKSGQQRGSSRREDVLDTVIALRYAKGDDTPQGAHFELHFEKNRTFYGDDAKAREVTLVSDENGSTWGWQHLNDSTFDRVVDRLNEGLSQKDVAIELEVNKGTVSKYARKAREAGLLINDKGDK